MPCYTFERPSGERLDLWFSMEEAPGWGDSIEHEGETLVRVMEDADRIAGADVVPEYRLKAYSQGRWDPEVQAAGGKYDSNGVGCFASKKALDNYCGRRDLVFDRFRHEH